VTGPPSDPNSSPDAAPPTDLSPDEAPGDSADAVSAALGTDDSGPVYYALEDWLTGYFLPMFRRTLGGEYRWCHQWWQHGEAISRLTALWHAWEVLRLQPGTGIATWYRDHLDHQLPILMGPRGPFYQCSETTHREPHQAEAAAAPDDWWDLGDGAELLPVPLPSAQDDEPAEDPGAHDDNA
jgi:Domain of unknown function (DUF4913)